MDDILPKYDKLKIEAIREARRHGRTYSQIEKEFGVSRWTTVNYLKGVFPGRDVVHNLALENAALDFFKKNDFYFLVDLNVVSNEPATDFLVSKAGEKWSVNVRSRSLALHGDDVFIGTIRLIPGYRNAIAILDENNSYPPIFLEISEVKETRSKKKFQHNGRE
jgi:hypothetical protein